jgi:hypothetical protein
MRGLRKSASKKGPRMTGTRKMTPKRRFLSGLPGGRVDRPPVGSVTSVANVEQISL